MQQTILILTNSINGLHSFRKEVVKAIVDAGYRVAIAVPDSDSPNAEYFLGIGCQVIQTTFNRRGTDPLADFRLMLTYIKIIRQFRPKVVLTYTIKPNVYGGMACRMIHTPQIANVTGLGDAVENGGLMQKLTIVLYRIGLKKAKRVFFQNQSNQDFCIQAGISLKGGALLPGSGVNLQHHIYQEYPNNEIIKFLYVGRIQKDKGCEELFEAAKRIKKQHTNVEFQFLGSIEGDYEKEVARLVKEGIISFHESTKDVRPFMGKAHCTIMPSYHEGMSNVNLESAANGRPVITTDVPGCRETVENGKTGYLVRVKNVESLVDGIERFISLPYEQKRIMGEQGRQKVEKEFDRQVVVNTYLKAIADV